MKKRYCDTNIITEFANESNLRNSLGEKGVDKFGEKLKGEKNEKTEVKSMNLDEGCMVSRNALIKDIGGNTFVAGALTSYGRYKKIDFRETQDSYIKGKAYYKMACESETTPEGFKKRFCNGKDVKGSKKLASSSKVDIMHLGSAVQLGAEEFITSNKRDFKPVSKFAKIKIK